MDKYIIRYWYGWGDIFLYFLIDIIICFYIILFFRYGYLWKLKIRDIFKYKVFCE